jgi:hypothetical protein
MNASSGKVFALAAMTLLLLLLISSCATGEDSLRQYRSAEPSAELSPREVVQTQMAAFRLNDEENKGIEIAFRFASPANRSVTGPLPRFIRLMQSPQYMPMLNHAEASVSEPVIRGNQAAVQVRMVDSGGRTLVYLFVLSRQGSGELEGAWMTDAVQVQGVEESGSQFV